MSNEYETLMRCVRSVRTKTDFVPKVALVLGSGLGDYASQLRVEATVDYHEIEGFPVSTVPGHTGRFVFGYVGDVPVVCMQGRVHYYEGYSMTEVVRPIRLMKLLGAEVLFLTNAAGGIQLGMKAGDLMLLTGQIASFVPSPYLQFTGPAYESPQEVAMARTLGADAVGMSTACEAVAANHMGMRIVGISCISNLACGISPQPLSHKEVQEAADAVAPVFQKLVTQMIKEIGTTCR